MKQSLKYILKVWLSSGLIASILFTVTSTCIYHYHFSAAYAIIWYLKGVLIYLVLNLAPCMVVLKLLRWTTSHFKTMFLTRLVLFVIVEIVVCVILLLLNSWLSSDFTNAIFWVSTIVATAFSVWLYKLPPSQVGVGQEG